MLRFSQGPLNHRLSRDPINDTPVILVGDVEVGVCYRRFMHYGRVLRDVYAMCCGGEDCKGVEFGVAGDYEGGGEAVGGGIVSGEG